MKRFMISKQATIAAVLASLGASKPVESKVANRLAVLGRAGFPEGAKSGQGHRAGYTVPQFWQLMIAFQIMRIGVPTGRAADIVSQSWDIAYSAIVDSLQSAANKITVLWALAPAGLPELEPFDQHSFVRPLATIRIKQGSSPQKVLSDLGVKHLALIDASSVVKEVMIALRDPNLQFDQRGFEAATAEWGAAVPDALRRHIKNRK